MNKKKLFIVFSFLFVVAVVSILLLVGMFSNDSMFKSKEDVVKMMEKIKDSDKLPMLETREIDIADKEQVESYTGIKSISLISDVVVNEPLMGSQAYSVVAIRVKDVSNVEKIKKEVYNNINMRKWICVGAEKLVVTNIDNLVFVVMTDEDWFDVSYNLFKDYVDQSVGKELIKKIEE